MLDCLDPIMFLQLLRFVLETHFAMSSFFEAFSESLLSVSRIKVLVC